MDFLGWLDPRPSTTPSERYFRPIILESSALHHHHPECFQHNPLVQIPSTYSAANPYHPQPPPLPAASVLSTVSSSQGELFSAFTFVPQSKHTSLNTKKFSTNNHVLADQSSSSADSGVHSSYTQSPITKHSFRKYVASSTITTRTWHVLVDANCMGFHLIVPHQSMLMMIKINISMLPTTNNSLFSGLFPVVLVSSRAYLSFSRETTSHHPTLETTASTDHPQEQYSLV